MRVHGILPVEESIAR